MVSPRKGLRCVQGRGARDGRCTGVVPIRGGGVWTVGFAFVLDDEYGWSGDRRGGNGKEQRDIRDEALACVWQ
jgi:hypothetical protein